MQLATKTEGSGPRRVALVHGLGGTGATWRTLVDRIVATEQWTVTTVDLRGHGQSARALSYTVDEFADDLAESLPGDLDLVVGHSLGGAVVKQAIGRLAPRAALYLDPGFGIGLPVEGVRARLFWAVPALSFSAIAVAMRFRGASPGPRSPEDQALAAEARAQHDQKMIYGVFHDVARHRVAPAPPEVPSTVVLSVDGDSVVPQEMAEALAGQGWDVRRLARVHHGFWTEDLDLSWNAIRDHFVA